MEKLIEALQILLKYGNPTYPIYCAHEKMCVLIDPSNVSDEDKEKLGELGFLADDRGECFYSFRYGSA